ncbi:RNA-directed DNA polymerase, partial [Proteus mirabilis]
MNILEELLTKGFFPIQLPPNFNSSSFGKNHEKINVGINRIVSADNKKNPYKDWTRTDKYSVARSSYYRRTTNILNPLSYFIIAKLIADNWHEINIHFKKSELSLSKPIIGEKSIRAITLTKFSQLYEKKILDSSGYKYALITDISSYFPSIYTHSIPWALHSKEVSKSNIKGSPLLGDKIDLHCRNAQDGQTVGLPIGSDTSHIISEIIGTAIDLELIKRLSTPPKGFRYVDDFCLFFTNKVEAEKTLAILTSIFNNYELNINASKTKIMETKDLIEESWRYG